MWERRLVDKLLRWRIAVLLVVAAISAVAAWQATKVTFDSDIETWFVEDDDNLRAYRAFLKRFEADEITILGVFADDVFTPELLTAMSAYTEAAWEIDNVHRVISLATVQLVRATGPGEVAIEPLMDLPPESAAEAAEIRKRAMESELLRDNLVNADGKAAAIIIEMSATGNDFDAKVAFVQALRAAAEKHIPKEAIWHLAGSPPLDEAMYLYTERDFGLLGPAALLVVVLISLFVFRRFSAALVPLAVVALANLWLFGLMGALGLKINMISSALMALILAVGVADSIHVISDYYQALMAGHDRDEAVAHSTASLIVPCLFTSATTAAGFLALLTSDLQPIREFGWLAAAGVGLAFLLSMTFIPAVLGVLGAPSEAYIEASRSGRLSRLLRRMGRPTLRSAKWIVAISAVLLVGAGYAATRINTDANPMNYFPPGDPMRVAMQRVDVELGGSSSFEFLIKTPPGALKEPATLRRIDELGSRLKTLPGVTTVMSLVDSLKETRKAMEGGAAEAAIVPDDKRTIAEYFFILESDETFRKLIQDDYSVTRMTARVRMSEAHLLTRKRDPVGSWLDHEYSGPDLNIESTGYIKLMADMEEYLFKSQVSGTLSALFVVTLMLLILLRSLRLTALSLIPNLVPILIGLAFMAVAGISLDPGTVMIGPMAIGLVVDDTVHFLVRLKRNLPGNSLEDAIDRAMQQTGRPIIVTSVALSLGFGTLMLGSFWPSIAFGLVAAVVVMMAMVADLVLLPAVMLVVRPKFAGHGAEAGEGS